MATLFGLRHTVTILVTDFTSPENGLMIFPISTFEIKKELRALTLVGHTRNNQELDPLAVIHLDN